MFDKFGKMNYDELIRTAKAEKEEGDEEALIALAQENGLDQEDAEDYMDDLTEVLCTPRESVVGYDHKREERLRVLYETRIEKLQKECTEIEEWVEAIPDSLTRRIFRMYYIDGIGQNKIAKRVHIAQSEVSKKISKYLQLE